MFEEVIVNENDAGYEAAEYLIDEAVEVNTTHEVKRPIVKLPGGITLKKTTMPVLKVSHVMSQSPQKPLPNVEDASEPPVKKKVPIVRKPGEVVTPVHLKTSGAVKVSPSIAPIPATSRIKTEWTKVPAQGIKEPLKTLKTPTLLSPVVNRVRSQPEAEDQASENDQPSDQEEEVEDEYNEATLESRASPEPSNVQLTRIEKKLDQILSKLTQHDHALKVLKYNVKDLRVELKNSTKQTAEIVSFDVQSAPIKRERKRLVLFPVADDNYLLRLEELAQADDEIRDEVMTLFNDAPTSSVYEYFRKNTYSLFENTSKYTWTGKPTNSQPTAPASQPACKMQLVELLITCGCDKFQNVTRDNLEKEFRRALSNFNDTKYAKRKRRMEKALLLAGVNPNTGEYTQEADGYEWKFKEKSSLTNEMMVRISTKGPFEVHGRS